jgi:Cellulase (glycosyl hydrolase family 5)
MKGKAILSLAVVPVAALLLACALLLTLAQRDSNAHATNPPEVTNALEHQTYDMYAEWFAWLEASGKPGFLGEHSVPNHEKGWTAAEINRWLTLFDKTYVWLDRNAGTVPVVTAHAASHSSFDKGGLRIYVPTSTSGTMAQRDWGISNEQAPVVEAHPAQTGRNRGVNAASGAMTQTGFDGGSPGTYGTHYTYPDRADYEYIKSRGLNTVRVPFRWERVQQRSPSSPNANPTLKAAEIARLKSSFDAAEAAGVKVIPSVQNYGDYIFSSSVFSTNKGEIGSSKLSVSAYAALWRQLATTFRGHPAISGYDLMNEPGNLAGGANQWENASQPAVGAACAADPNTRIWVSGYHTRSGQPGQSYNGLYSFVDNHPEPWIESSCPFGYTTHVYYGPGAGYGNTYAEAVALWESRGY